jgi:hypothetical protein
MLDHQEAVMEFQVQLTQVVAVVVVVLVVVLHQLLEETVVLA